MAHVSSISRNGNSWHVTLKRRELMARGLTPGTAVLVQYLEDAIVIRRAIGAGNLAADAPGRVETDDGYES